MSVCMFSAWQLITGFRSNRSINAECSIKMITSEPEEELRVELQVVKLVTEMLLA